MPAVSVRRIRGPRRMPSNPAARNSSRSRGDQPPSGPIASTQLALAFAQRRRRPAHGRPWDRATGAALTRRQRAQRIRQRLRRCNRRHPARPLCSHAATMTRLPVREALAGALAIELHLAALALDRDDRGDAQFGRLLQDPVHLLAARQRLQQGDAQRRFVVERARGEDFHLARSRLPIAVMRAS